MSVIQLLVVLAVLSLACGKIIDKKFPRLDKDSTRSQEIMLPMRDGVELHTVVHLPRTHIKAKGKVPTVMDRSPYG